VWEHQFSASPAHYIRIRRLGQLFAVDGAQSNMNRLLRYMLALGILLWQGFSYPASAEENERRLSVIYDPPSVSVEASGVSLPEMLQAIGAEANFTVVAPPGNHLPRAFAFHESPLHEVLQYLLQGENSAVVYRNHGGGREIEKILLLRPPGYGQTVAESRARKNVQSYMKTINPNKTADRSNVSPARPRNPTSRSRAKSNASRKIVSRKQKTARR